MTKTHLFYAYKKGFFAIFSNFFLFFFLFFCFCFLERGSDLSLETPMTEVAERHHVPSHSDGVSENRWCFLMPFLDLFSNPRTFHYKSQPIFIDLSFCFQLFSFCFGFRSLGFWFTNISSLGLVSKVFKSRFLVLVSGVLSLFVCLCF